MITSPRLAVVIAVLAHILFLFGSPAVADDLQTSDACKAHAADGHCLRCEWTPKAEMKFSQSAATMPSFLWTAACANMRPGRAYHVEVMGLSICGSNTVDSVNASRPI